YAIVGSVVVGRTWYLSRLPRGLGRVRLRLVVWTKRNQTLWDDVKPNEATKL
ncbi:hypothetical protein FOMPIDRAFT_1124528, partial [Fomitopsis schrenkii]